MSDDAMAGGNPTNRRTIPSVSITLDQTGVSTQANELGMRPMQARAWRSRAARYLLIKSPPASGKSRALMFVALDKLNKQGLKQAIVVVPERSIGGSFADEALTEGGFPYDWHVEPRWNLCDAPGVDAGSGARSKVKAVAAFLESASKALVCTHATFRFAVRDLGVEAFDDRLIAIDEFHHVSADSENNLGEVVRSLMARGKAHLVAMTGSYFRGDAAPVLRPEDEARFETVKYTYFEQLNGYRYLKALDVGYFFYTGRYVDALEEVLDPTLKTIVHIPNVNARESLGDKRAEVDEILGSLGEWMGRDPETGFHLVRSERAGRTLRVADLVDDEDAGRRTKILNALKDPRHKEDPGWVDVIIALGMAKEGFDWIWCEHALTVGYRSSLTEIVQIIGRATRDAKDKARTRFTNLIAEPDADREVVAEAINDTLKAISASLLMEQVLAPKYDFTPKDLGRRDDLNYGPEGYCEGESNVGQDPTTGTIHMTIKGIRMPETPEATRIVQEDLTELLASFVQDDVARERGLFDQEGTPPEDLTQERMGKIVRERYPALSEYDAEAVRQHAIAAMVVTQKGKEYATGGEGERANLSLLEGVRKFDLSVTELEIDMIDQINPFGTAYAILAKAMDETTLRQVQESIAAKKTPFTLEKAREATVAAVKFKEERGRLPEVASSDEWERYLALGMAAFRKYQRDEKAKEAES